MTAKKDHLTQRMLLLHKLRYNEDYPSKALLAFVGAVASMPEEVPVPTLLMENVGSTEAIKMLWDGGLSVTFTAVAGRWVKKGGKEVGLVKTDDLWGYVIGMGLLPNAAEKPQTIVATGRRSLDLPGVIPKGVDGAVYSDQNEMLERRVRLEESYLAEAHYVVAKRMDGFGVWCPSAWAWAADRVFSRVKRAFEHRAYLEDQRRPGTVVVARGEPVADTGENPIDNTETLQTQRAVGGPPLPRALDLGDEEDT